MRVSFSLLVLSGLVISAITFFISGGGKKMSMKNNDAEALIGIASPDRHLSDRLETATFALG